MRQIGLKNIKVAKLLSDTDEGTTYDLPRKLERAISAKITPSSVSEKLYSDDDVEEIIGGFESCEVEIEINQLSLESRAFLQGSRLVDGELAESKNDIAPEIALGFQSLKSDGTYKHVWLYKGKFELAEDEFQTKTDKVESKTPKLKGTFFARVSDGLWRISLDESDIEGTEVEKQTRINNFTQTVPNPIAETP